MMPDKLISMYDIGPSSERVVDNGLSVGDLLDDAVHPYYGGYAPPGYVDIPGLPDEQIGAAAIWLEQTDPARTPATAGSASTPS